VGGEIPPLPPAPCKKGTRSFSWVKGPGYGADHPSTSGAKVMDGLELYLCLPSVPAFVCHRAIFTFHTY